MYVVNLRGIGENTVLFVLVVVVEVDVFVFECFFVSLLSMFITPYKIFITSNMHTKKKEHIANIKAAFKSFAFFSFIA